MRYLALLALYALIAALVVPGSILAQDQAAPGATETAPADPAAADPAPPEPAPAEPAPAQTAPAPAEPAPAPAEPAPAPPEPQFLADERAESQPKAQAAASGSVTITDFTYSPGTITINQGDSVTWVNDGPTPHSATSSNGAFDTGIFPKGQSRSHTFNEAGSFAYICTPHPFMKGTVVVQAAQTEGGGDSSGSGDTGGTGATAAQDDGPALPNSGADAGALLLLGGLMLLLGIAMHRRSAAREPRPVGRIGW